MPVQRVHFEVSSEEPEKSSDQRTLKPEMGSGAVARIVLLSAASSRSFVTEVDIIRTEFANMLKDRLELN